ncbi:MAG: hypothetical protein GXY80_10240 [Syntrophorhabdus aromaticivorans]|uniref:Uncharacterized protein n=1 Tax=Syntrophorhabdus aromaticivorans TaxID=328301 RepID=A0A351U1D7_9BACT|nr:hypothetical protein [Syntrophorhabdus aromaticivorans]HBA53768.1 hypothetical protein [Syntrophorhabdus aromaticivorans]
MENVRADEQEPRHSGSELLCIKTGCSVDINKATLFLKPSRCGAKHQEFKKGRYPEAVGPGAKTD